MKSIHDTAKNLAYTEGVRSLIRRGARIQAPQTLVKMIHRTSIGATLRSLTSPTPPSGHWYARLRIPQWHTLVDESFHLRYEGKTIYGNVVEPPEKKYPLEYRNIPVESTDLSKFDVVVTTGERSGENLDFTLDFSSGTFSTREQILYDERFGVHQYGNIFFALRGNTTAPTKIIFTFPGLGMSSGRIVYPVSAMKDIRDKHLESALMVVFQDRYLVPGSYMLLDTWGRSIYSDISRIIRGFINKFNLTEADTMFFGASKGASSAIYYSREFPDAHLLISTPQLHLPTYFTKPALRSNLYLQRGFYEFEEAGRLLLRYIDEGRKIDLLYTNNDELSNQSFIEFEQDGANLTKYRLPGVHTAVAKQGLATLVGIMRQFLGNSEDTIEARADASVVSVEVLDSQLVKITLDMDEQFPSSGLNWYLEKAIGKTRQRYMVTMDAERRSLYTSAEAWFNLALDRLDAQWSIYAISKEGQCFSGRITGWDKVRDATAGTQLQVIKPQILHINSARVRSYTIVNRYKVLHFNYRSLPGELSAGTTRFIFVDDISAPLPDEMLAEGTWRRTVIVEPESDAAADVFALRFLARDGIDGIHVVIRTADPELGRHLLRRFTDLDWENVTIDADV
ncbi:MAG: hypothetical protein PUK59_06000 [Actinomycetaceae bacterium]|nr:hypothetical protein [Actinomycetaceae bacterium]MDY5855158.1 hypothetical protein [Arcanobacterium sp.]